MTLLHTHIVHIHIGHVVLLQYYLHEIKKSYLHFVHRILLCTYRLPVHIDFIAHIVYIII